MQAVNSECVDTSKLSRELIAGLGVLNAVSPSRKEFSTGSRRNGNLIAAEDYTLIDKKQQIPKHPTPARNAGGGIDGGSRRAMQNEDAEEKPHHPFRSRDIRSTVWRRRMPSWAAKKKRSRKRTKGLEEIVSKEEDSTTSSLAQPTRQSNAVEKTTHQICATFDDLSIGLERCGRQDVASNSEIVGVGGSCDKATSITELQKEREALKNKLKLTKKRIDDIDYALRGSQDSFRGLKKSIDCTSADDTVVAQNDMRPPDTEAPPILNETESDEGSCESAQCNTIPGQTSANLSPRSVVSFSGGRPESSRSLNAISVPFQSPSLSQSSLLEHLHDQVTQDSTYFLSKPRSVSRPDGVSQHGRTPVLPRRRQTRTVRFRWEDETKDDEKGFSDKPSPSRTTADSRDQHLTPVLKNSGARGSPTNPRTPPSLNSFFEEQKVDGIPVAADLPRSEDGDTLSRSTADTSENAVSIYDSRSMDSGSKKNALVRHEKKTASLGSFLSEGYAPVAFDHHRSVDGDSISRSSSESNSVSIYDVDYESKKVMRSRPRGAKYKK